MKKQLLVLAQLICTFTQSHGMDKKIRLAPILCSSNDDYQAPKKQKTLPSIEKYLRDTYQFELEATEINSKSSAETEESSNDQASSNNNDTQFTISDGNLEMCKFNDRSNVDRISHTNLITPRTLPKDFDGFRAACATCKRHFYKATLKELKTTCKVHIEKVHKVVFEIDKIQMLTSKVLFARLKCKEHCNQEFSATDRINTLYTSYKKHLEHHPNILDTIENVDEYVDEYVQNNCKIFVKNKIDLSINMPFKRKRSNRT